MNDSWFTVSIQNAVSQENCWWVDEESWYGWGWNNFQQMRYALFASKKLDKVTTLYLCQNQNASFHIFSERVILLSVASLLSVMLRIILKRNINSVVTQLIHSKVTQLYCENTIVLSLYQWDCPLWMLMHSSFTTMECSLNAPNSCTVNVH